MCASADSRIFAVAKKRGRKKNSKVDYEKHRLADQPTWQVSCNPELSPRLDRPAAVAPTVPDDQESDAIQLLLAVASGDADAMPAIEDGSDSSEEEDSSEEDSSSEEEEEEAIQEWGDTSRGEIARARKEKQPSAAVQDRMLHVDDMLSCANAQYAEEFVWSERKLMAVRAYYACLKLQLPVLTATDVARHAANTDERTVRYWVADFENNHGWFSASLWGTNTKTPSLMAWSAGCLPTHAASPTAVALPTTAVLPTATAVSAGYLLVYAVLPTAAVLSTATALPAVRRRPLAAGAVGLWAGDTRDELASRRDP